MNRNYQTHAKSTVKRNQDGGIENVTIRAEYYEEDLDKHENDDDRYLNGVNATFNFNVNGNTATLTDVKKINDGAKRNYDTDLQFIRAIPIAEDAVMNIPGVEDVESTEGYIMKNLDMGRNAV